MDTKISEIISILPADIKFFDSIFKEIFKDKPAYKKIFAQKKAKIYDFIESVPEILKGLNPSDYNIVEGWLNVAMKDIEASEKLFKNNNLENAVYHIQQAVEKLLKSYVLRFGLFKEKDLRNIGHVPLHIYIKLLRQSWITEVQDLFGLKGDISKSIRELEQLTNIRDKSTKEKLLKLDKALPVFIKMYKKTYKKLNYFLSNKETKELLEITKPYPDIENLIRALHGFAWLLLPLAATTPLHESATRYPDVRRKIDIDYEKTEIVKNNKEVISLVKENLERFKKLIKEEKEKKINFYSILLQMIKPYLKEIENLKSDEQKLQLIREVVEKIKKDEKVMDQIEKIKSHPWVKVIECGVK